MALLAATCSSIGSDSTPNPKLLANIEKSAKSGRAMDQRDKGSSPGSGSTFSNGSASENLKSSFKPYESNFKDTDSNTPDDLRINNRNKSQNKTTSTTPQSNQHQQQQNHNNNNERCESTHSNNSQRKSPSASASPKIINDKNTSSSASLKPTSSANESLKSDPHKELRNLASASAAYPSIVNSSMPYFNGYPYPMDYLTTNALMSQHQSMLKAAALNPYLNYARMKAASSGHDSMMGICRDPYCTGCALSSHFLGKNGSSCPAGCTQCDHGKSMSANNAAVAYAHAQLAQLAAASQMPYVCNWIAGDQNYCGKRYATSEELFQHLRAEHTGNAIPDSMINPSAPNPLSSFPRAYPTPPLSPLSSARYHPYSKAPLLPPSLNSASLAGIHPSLAQYFSPYAMYPRSHP